MKRGKTYDWIPLWRQKWLWGSTRLELDPAERSIWIDLLCIAGNDDGHIRANQDTPYGREQLAGMLVVPLPILNSAIEKCIKFGKLIEAANGTLSIKSWQEYQLVPRHKKRFESQNCDAESQYRGHYTETETETNTEKETETEILIPNGIRGRNAGEIVSLWNGFAVRHGLAEVKGIPEGSSRQRLLRSRMKKPDFDFVTLLQIIESSPFLLGQGARKGDRPFFVTFDWAIRPSNYQKIIEGNYLDRKFSGIAEWLRDMEERGKADDNA